MSRKRILAGLTVAGVMIALISPVLSENVISLRKGSAINMEDKAPTMAKPENKDLKRVRNYPEQPPTIPHAVRDYQVTTGANKCLSCHARTRTGESQAPMVSVTHFMDREGQVLATISPRRYFCSQCHVIQGDVPPLVENEFIDAVDLLNKRKANQ